MSNLSEPKPSPASALATAALTSVTPATAPEPAPSGSVQDNGASTAREETSLPRLNRPAPHFEGRSTHGFLRLGDFSGKWLVFFCHPADFTPVCASEFVSFSRQSDAFAALDCRLLGLSIDSVFAHLAWREAIRERFGVSVEFPILEDSALTISRRYGMVHPDAHGAGEGDVRALFVIDPAGLLRAMIYYPLTTGRSVNEVLRLVQALQITDREQVLTPEGWQPGRETIEPPPQSVQAAEGRRSASYGCVDWYYYTRPGSVG